jgi:hypothetical protein
LIACIINRSCNKTQTMKQTTQRLQAQAHPQPWEKTRQRRKKYQVPSPKSLTRQVNSHNPFSVLPVQSISHYLSIPPCQC